MLVYLCSLHSPVWKGSGYGYSFRWSDFYRAAVISEGLEDSIGFPATSPWSTAQEVCSAMCMDLFILLGSEPNHTAWGKGPEKCSLTVCQRRKDRNQWRVTQSANFWGFLFYTFPNHILAPFFSLDFLLVQICIFYFCIFFVYARRHWFHVDFIHCKCFLQSVCLITLVMAFYQSAI